MSLDQHHYIDTELWNNQFVESKMVGVLFSWPMRALVCMASRDKVAVDAFYKGIQYALKKPEESRKSALKEQQCQILKAKTCGLWE